MEEIQEEIIIPFEPLYELVKDKKDRNIVWFEYEPKLIKIINGLSYWKNFDKDELIQQAYVNFCGFCEIYDPYYNGNFIPFDKFLFKNIIIKLRAYIQRYYFKNKREQPTEFDMYVPSTKREIEECDDKIFQEYIFSLINPTQQEVLKLTMQGYKQKEVGKHLNISQSRVSVIKSKTLKKLNNELNNEGKKKTKKWKW